MNVLIEIVVQSLSCVQLFVTPWTEACQAFLSSTSPSAKVCSDSCPLSWWCYLTISSSATHFSSCPQSFPPLGSLPMSRLFIAGGQSIGASASASVLPMNIQGWLPLGLTGLILLSKWVSFFFFFLVFLIFISWRLIILQYWSGFCHTLTWISHGFTCVPHPEPPSHLPPHLIPLGHPSAPALSTCQESSPALQSEGISSSALSLLYGPTLTSVHNYWKTYSFNCMDLCQQNDVFVF